MSRWAGGDHSLQTDYEPAGEQHREELSPSSTGGTKPGLILNPSGRRDRRFPHTRELQERATTEKCDGGAGKTGLG